LYRKLSDADFCSSAHRKAYHADQEQLAIQRLMEQQQQLDRASRMPTVQDLLGDRLPVPGVIFRRPAPLTGGARDPLPPSPGAPVCETEAILPQLDARAVLEVKRGGRLPLPLAARRWRRSEQRAEPLTPKTAPLAPRGDEIERAPVVGGLRVAALRRLARLRTRGRTVEFAAPGPESTLSSPAIRPSMDWARGAVCAPAFSESAAALPLFRPRDGVDRKKAALPIARTSARMEATAPEALLSYELPAMGGHSRAPARSESLLALPMGAAGGVSAITVAPVSPAEAGSPAVVPDLTAAHEVRREPGFSESVAALPRFAARAGAPGPSRRHLPAYLAAAHWDPAAIRMPVLGRLSQVVRGVVMRCLEARDQPRLLLRLLPPLSGATRAWLPLPPPPASSALRAGEQRSLALAPQAPARAIARDEPAAIDTPISDPESPAGMAAPQVERRLAGAGMAALPLEIAAPGSTLPHDPEPMPQAGSPRMPESGPPIRTGSGDVRPRQLPYRPVFKSESKPVLPAPRGPAETFEERIEAPRFARNGAVVEPPCASMVRLGVLRPVEPARSNAGGYGPEALGSAPLLPATRLEARGKLRLPALDAGADSDPAEFAAPRNAHAFSWAPLAQFRHAPVHVRVFGLLALLCATGAVAPDLPRVAVEKTTSVNLNDPRIGAFVNDELVAVKHTIASRAGVELVDDFRSGLDNWVSRRDLTRSWSYDSIGFVHPGPLALYRPSMGLTDYQFDFLGEIDRRALGWVVRAQDFENYYALKLVIERPGPLPVVDLVRYAVIRGRVEGRKEIPLPFTVRNDTLYRVHVQVSGPDFAVSVQDQLVDFWTDGRLPSGGIGFFSGRGEQSRIRWVQVSHQYDALGRLCAYLTPFAMASYNLQSTDGSWK
jgi:hypothetical protein